MRKDNSKPERRKGMSIIEMIAALGLLGAAMAIMLPFFGRLNMVRQDVADRELAIHELRNLVEQGLATHQFEGLQLSAEIKHQLEESELNVLHDSADDLGLVRHRLNLSWINRTGQRTPPVELVVWHAEEQDE